MHRPTNHLMLITFLIAITFPEMGCDLSRGYLYRPSVTERASRRTNVDLEKVIVLSQNDVTVTITEKNKKPAAEILVLKNGPIVGVSSQDTKIATGTVVEEDGEPTNKIKITGNAPGGPVTITLSNKHGYKADICVLVRGIALDKESVNISLDKGESTAVVRVLNDEQIDKIYSDRPEIAEAELITEENGDRIILITGKSHGETYITISNDDGVSKKIKVKVTGARVTEAKDKEIKLSEDKVTLTLDKKRRQTEVLVLNNGPIKVAGSRNPQIAKATVEANGKKIRITGYLPDETIITVSNEHGETKKIDVYVKKSLKVKRGWAILHKDDGQTTIHFESDSPIREPVTLHSEPEGIIEQLSITPNDTAIEGDIIVERSGQRGGAVTITLENENGATKEVLIAVVPSPAPGKEIEEWVTYWRGSLETETDPITRGMTILELVQLGPAASIAVPDLINVLTTDKSSYVRHHTTFVLGYIRPQTEEAVSALINTLENEDESPDVRALAAWALGEIGPGAQDSIPALKKVAGNNDEQVPFRHEANEAIKKIRAKKKPKELSR